MRERRAAYSRFESSCALIEAIEPRRLFAAVLLNELEPNDPGKSDNRYQFVELAGAPGMSLANDYFVAFAGINSTGTIGVADLVVNLSPYAIGSNGFLVIKSPAGTGHVLPAATTLVPVPSYFTATGGLPNGSLSFYLFNSTTPLVAGTDYDTNNDGVLDHLPTGATVIDHVAVLNTNNSKDVVFGGVVVTENPQLNKGTADAVTRFPGNTAVASAAWFGGELVDTGNVGSQLQYDATRKADNEPANAYLTPGGFNCTPTFAVSAYSYTVTKPTPVGTTVGIVSATPVGTDTTTYGLTDTGAANFTVNASGTVTVAVDAPAGTYNLSVTATDDQTGGQSAIPLTVVVRRGSSVVALSSDVSSAAYGQIVSLTAVVSPSAATGTVQFKDNGVNLGGPVPVATGGATLTTTSLSAGGHAIVAVYTGDTSYNAASSSTASINVIPAAIALSADSLYLRTDTDRRYVDVWTGNAGDGTPARQLLANSVISISAHATSLTVDFSNGPVVIPITFDGPNLLVSGGGDETGDVVTVDAGSITVDGNPITFSPSVVPVFVPGEVSTDLQLTAGALTIRPGDGRTVSQFSSVVVAAGARLTLADTANRTLLVTSSLTPSGTIDLTDNDLVVAGGDLGAITDRVRTGYLGNPAASWTGAGITSSVAASDSRRRTALGVVQNNQSGSPLFGPDRLLDGYAPGPSDVIVGFTLVGDANLDRRVDGSDYALIDGRTPHATGWFAGDFNDDGVVDPSDYTLIDDAFNNQTPTPPTAPTVATAVDRTPATTVVVLSPDEQARRKKQARGPFVANP